MLCPSGQLPDGADGGRVTVTVTDVSLPKGACSTDGPAAPTSSPAPCAASADGCGPPRGLGIGPVTSRVAAPPSLGVSSPSACGPRAAGGSAVSSAPAFGLLLLARALRDPLVATRSTYSHCSPRARHRAHGTWPEHFVLRVRHFVHAFVLRCRGSP